MNNYIVVNGLWYLVVDESVKVFTVKGVKMVHFRDESGEIVETELDGIKVYRF